MLDRIKALFVEEVDQSPTLQPELAAAALMFEVVWADHQIEESELNIMKTHLLDAFGVDEHQLEHIVTETKKLHDESVGLHEFTRALNGTVSQEEKKKIVAALWRIAIADAEIDALEEHMIRRISDLLYVSHRDFIDAKISAKRGALNKTHNNT